MSRGILYVIGASLIFGCMPSINKYVILSGISVASLTCYVQLIVSLTALSAAKFRNISVLVTRRQLICLLIVGAGGMGLTSFLINSAVLYIPVGLTTVLHFLYPTVVSVAMVVFFGQKMTGFKLLAILCSISGMVLITNPGGGQVRGIGILMALCSSLTYSAYMIANDRGEINTLPLIVKLIYTSLGSALMFGVVAAATGQLNLPGTPQAAAVMVVLCSMGNLSAFYLITAGIKEIGAGAASFINMLEPVTSVIVSAVAYREHLGLTMVLGMALILAAVFLVALNDAIR